MSLLAGTTLAASPQDTVTIRGADGEIKQRTGLVVDVNGERLVLQVNEREQKIPYPQVVEYRTSIDALAQPGDELYAERKFELAFAAYGQGIEATTPAWMRRRLLAGRVKSAVQMQAWTQAAEDYLSLVNSDPQTEHFATIPLAWMPSRPDAGVARKVAAWLASKHKLEQLIGASHGLTGLNREGALQVLSVLAKDPDPRISALATAQRWRTEPAPSPEELGQWDAQVNAMPVDLQAGPLFVLGSARVQSEPEQAILSLMKIPVLYPEQFALAARGLAQSAEQLLKLNRTAEAQIVLQELVDRHGGTAEADFAEKQLSALATATDGK